MEPISVILLCVIGVWAAMYLKMAISSDISEVEAVLLISLLASILLCSFSVSAYEVCERDANQRSQRIERMVEFKRNSREEDQRAVTIELLKLMGEKDVSADTGRRDCEEH